jgi:hypothetical protein
MPLIVSEWERLPRPTRLDNRSRVASLFNGTPDILDSPTALRQGGLALATTRHEKAPPARSAVGIFAGAASCYAPDFARLINRVFRRTPPRMSGGSLKRRRLTPSRDRYQISKRRAADRFEHRAKSNPIPIQLPFPTAGIADLAQHSPGDLLCGSAVLCVDLWQA